MCSTVLSNCLKPKYHEFESLRTTSSATDRSPVRNSYPSSTRTFAGRDTCNVL